MFLFLFLCAVFCVWLWWDIPTYLLRAHTLRAACIYFLFTFGCLHESGRYGPLFTPKNVSIINIQHKIFMESNKASNRIRTTTIVTHVVFVLFSIISLILSKWLHHSLIVYSYIVIINTYCFRMTFTNPPYLHWSQ